MAEEDSNSLEYTPTWVVAAVCFVIVLTSLIAERGLHRLGKCLKHKKQDALFEALQKLKEELMLLGFISLLLTVSQGALSRMCVPPYLTSKMLPCKRHVESNNEGNYSFQAINSRRRLLSDDTSNSQHCEKGKVPLMSLEALHHLHIFIFVLAVVHVIFCATTMVLGGARIRQWKRWEDWIRDQSEVEKVLAKDSHVSHHHELFKHYLEFLEEHAGGYWKKSAVVGWIISFFKQFYGSVTKSDYIALREGFIMAHCPANLKFDFHKYMVRTLEVDFKRVVSISWHLWLFVVVFLLLNMEGWHSYFWLSFLPLALLLLVGAKLEHIIARLAQEISESKKQDQEAAQVKPSDEHFWFHRPGIVLDLIHFILFQNAFEIAFFFWILSTYGLHSCMMEKKGYIITRLIMGIIVQVLCSYSTLPLYALVTQMGSKFKKGMFEDFVHDYLNIWARTGGPKSRSGDTSTTANRMMMMASTKEIDEREMVALEQPVQSETQINF